MKRVQTPAQIRRLVEAHSSFWPSQLAAHPDDIPWLLSTHPLERARSPRSLETEWRTTDWNSFNRSETFGALARLKRREMLRITVRDLAGYCRLEDTVAELSALADFCLRRALKHCQDDMEKRHGTPKAQFGIFGMGKLGGEELNYSSDIDLIFVYSEEGLVEGPDPLKRGISNHDFFTRVADGLIEGFRAGHEEGKLFRVDLRLRPEGNSGPITRSLESYENYYAAFGEVWERMAMQKARFVAGDPEMGYEFIQRLQPFCFPRHLGPSALDEIFQIKARIESEILKEGGLERHVKLGRGGIREIEFSVQALQLLHGARQPFMQERGTLKSLRALRRLDLLSGAETTALNQAYVFLRRIEHRLQMRDDRQTHVVPEDPATQLALAKGLGFKTRDSFLSEWKAHCDFVHSFFHRIVRPAGGVESTPMGTPGGTEKNLNANLVKELISETAEPPSLEPFRRLGFENPKKAAETLRTLARGPEYAHVSQRTRGLFHQLCPLLLDLTLHLARPDFVLQQLERFIEAYGPRAALYEMLLSNSKLLELLCRLFDHSQFFSEIMISQPVLLESIAFEGLLAGGRDRMEMQRLLARETAETENERLLLFKASELLRIALRDILGLAQSSDETNAELSLLADVCLQSVLSPQDSALSPQSSGPRTSLCVIALGKYGGRELTYGSDLDVFFIGGTVEEAARVIAQMGGERGGSAIFKMDPRLRPDGEKGVLTLPLDAYESYYKQRAQFWERQALTRARFAGGNAKIGSSFLKLVDELIYSKPLTADELREMIGMRTRIEKERGDINDPARDYKTGAGGLVEVEFLAQAQQLRYGWQHESLRRCSTTEALRAMPTIAGWKSQESAVLIEDYNWLRRLESALRRDYNAPVSQLPSHREHWEAPARHMDFKNAAELEAELLMRRKRIRKLAGGLMRP